MSVRPLSLTVNGAPVSVTPRTGLTLLAHLRNELGLTGTKTGCSTGACGACTVVMNGLAEQACQVPAATLQDADVQTVEGLVRTPTGRAVAEALIAAGAAQCGYCLPGIVAAASAAFARDGAAADLPAALSRNLCRCGTHVRILAALERVKNASGAGV